MSEVTTQAKPERRKRQKLEDMEGYKPSIYGLTRDELIDWAMEHGEKKFRATTNLGLALQEACAIFRRNDQHFKGFHC